MTEQKLFRTLEAAELAGIKSAEPKNSRFLFMNCIKKLALAPAAEKPREGKGGKPEKFWTMEQIEEVKKLRASFGKKDLPVADVIVEPATIDTNPAEELTALTLEQRADKIRRLQADVQRGIIEIGFELIAAKHEVGHGQWAIWLQENFEWTQQTANNFMRIAERFGKFKNVFQFQPSTLQAMLALPEGAEEDFVREQTETGKPLENQSAREVKKNVREWKQKRAEEKKSFDTANDSTEEPADADLVIQNSAEPPALIDAIVTPAQVIAIRELINQTDDLQTLKTIRDSLLEVVLLTETKIGELSRI